MASTYTSKYIIPGRRAGPIKQIINYKTCNTINLDSNYSTPTEPFVITSGTPTVEYNNGYYTITFLDNGGIKFLVPLTSGDNDFNALVVGGGGGGGYGGFQNTGFYRGTVGGGGGAGGEVIYNSISVDQYFNYNVIVGQGGLSSTNGSPSSFSTINASGGNFGNDAIPNGPGGQGGFGVNDNDGGTGGYSVDSRAGYYDSPPTNGHNGIPITISSTTTYYAGGGGGGAYNNTLQSFTSVGGSGGGGNGSIPNAGLPNTGGGGGGNGDPNNPSLGGQGGSGIVILYFKYTAINSTTKTTTTSSTTCKVCICPSPINSKIVKNSNPDVIPGSTQRERVVNAIRYSSGRIVFGNAPYNSNGDTLLGRLQGEPLPKFLSRNRF
jgi:hypothetical protein